MTSNSVRLLKAVGIATAGAVGIAFLVLKINPLLQSKSNLRLDHFRRLLLNDPKSVEPRLPYPLSASDTLPSNPNGTRIVCSAEDGACVDNVGVVGEWKFVGPNRLFVAPVCTCSLDSQVFSDNDKHKYSKQCTFEGKKSMFYSGNPEHYTNYGRNLCCEEFIDEYEWQAPNLVQSFDFDPVDTCRLLGNRKVLLIGDSTMAQTATTLMNSLLPGKCQTQIIYAMSDTLIGQDFGYLNRGKVWRDYVEEVKADIVFLSVGAHVQELHNFMDIVEQVLSEVQEMQQKNTAITFAWKTQQPKGCSKDILSPKDWHNKDLYVIDRAYAWGQFYQRDLLLISRLQSIGMPYLDVRMLYSRTDAHRSSQKENRRDCLHLCSPGPLDVVGRLFHQFLVNQS